jgi:hypothetical protein
MDTPVARSLIAAYLDTDYAVEDPRLRCVLAVGQHSDPLAQWLRAQGWTCAAFITACNPRSRLLDEAENARRMDALDAALAELRLPVLAANGRSRIGAHNEPSRLVAGIALGTTHALMRRFEQNAFLWIGADAVPQLVWTDGL